MRRISFLFIACLLQVFAQNPIFTPPASTVRTAAEWEEVETLVISWTSFPAIHKEIVRYAQQECKVLISCPDSNDVKSYLFTNGVPITANVHFLQAPFNSIWARDYSANTIYQNEVEDRALVDWVYNRNRPSDDVLPLSQANYFNIPLYQTSQAPYELVNTGGNFMSDGFGTAFASKLILNDNLPGNPYTQVGKTEAEIDSIMKWFMGINRYIKMPTLPYDGIHHIDMHMKLLDEETLLIGEYPTGIADGPQIEANIQYIQDNFLSKFGTPYKIVRIPMPPNQNGAWPSNGGDYLTYTNNVFINKLVLVPTYREQYDTTALRILRENLPGYNVQGIDCDNTGSNIIQLSGALHCITHSIGVEQPLLISHQALQDTDDTINPYTVNAYIHHRSGIEAAWLMYRTTTGVFDSIPMTEISATTHTWSAQIPAQALGTHIQYYVAARANSGKELSRPITAPQGFWEFDILLNIANEEPVFSTLEAVFPNPAQAITCIPIYCSQREIGRLSLRDMTGQEVEVLHEGNFELGASRYYFDAQNYASGIYYVCWKTSTQQFVQKIVIR